MNRLSRIPHNYQRFIICTDVHHSILFIAKNQYKLNLKVMCKISAIFLKLYSIISVDVGLSQSTTLYFSSKQKTTSERKQCNKFQVMRHGFKFRKWSQQDIQSQLHILGDTGNSKINKISQWDFDMKISNAVRTSMTTIVSCCPIFNKVITLGEKLVKFRSDVTPVVVPHIRNEIGIVKF